jgi:hypothetical protein
VKKKYIIEVNNERIGYTEFEYADTPMGVVHGKIFFEVKRIAIEMLCRMCYDFFVDVQAIRTNYIIGACKQ